MGKWVGLEDFSHPGLLRKGGLKGGPSLLLTPMPSLPAGVGKSSLLLRFADNTFSGESSWVLLGALILKSPTLSRAYLLLSDAGDFTIQVVA